MPKSYALDRDTVERMNRAVRKVEQLRMGSQVPSIYRYPFRSVPNNTATGIEVVMPTAKVNYHTYTGDLFANGFYALDGNMVNLRTPSTSGITIRVLRISSGDTIRLNVPYPAFKHSWPKIGGTGETDRTEYWTIMVPLWGG